MSDWQERAAEWANEAMEAQQGLEPAISYEVAWLNASEVAQSENAFERALG